MSGYDDEGCVVDTYPLELEVPNLSIFLLDTLDDGEGLCHGLDAIPRTNEDGSFGVSPSTVPAFSLVALWCRGWVFGRRSGR